MLESCFEFGPSGALIARGLFHTPSDVKDWEPVIGWYGNACALGADSSPSATTASASTRRGEMRFMVGMPPWDKRVLESRRNIRSPTPTWREPGFPASPVLSVPEKHNFREGYPRFFCSRLDDCPERQGPVARTRGGRRKPWW